MGRWGDFVIEARLDHLPSQKDQGHGQENGKEEDLKAEIYRAMWYPRYSSSPAIVSATCEEDAHLLGLRVHPNDPEQHIFVEEESPKPVPSSAGAGSSSAGSQGQQVVAIKVLPLPDEKSGNKLDRERAMVRKREVAVLKRLQHRSASTFIIELLASLEIDDWPNVRQRCFRPHPDHPLHADQGQLEARGATPGEAAPTTTTTTTATQESVREDEHERQETASGESGQEARMASGKRRNAVAIVMPYHRWSLLDYLQARSQQSQDSDHAHKRGHKDEQAAANQGLEVDEALVLLKQMATAIAYCHRHGICHRDVKLENFMWHEAKREVRLIDLGSCGIMRGGKLFSHACGSIAYMAPEVVQGKGYNENVDIFALGVCFYALLTGRFPFGSGANEAEPPAEVFYRIVHQRISVPQHVSPEVADLLLSMLSRDRRRRLSAEGVLGHEALINVSLSLGDPEQLERERRRRAKGKEKDDAHHDDDDQAAPTDPRCANLSKKRKQYPGGQEEGTRHALC